MFVLGEVCALYDKATLLWLAAAVVLLTLPGFFRGRDLEKIILSLLCLAFLLLGWRRMEVCKDRFLNPSPILRSYEKANESCGGKLFSSLSGKIAGIEIKKGRYILTMEKCRFSFGKESGELSRVIVYLDEKTADIVEKTAAVGRSAVIGGQAELFERARNPGAFDYALYYASLKTDCRMYGESISFTGEERNPCLDFLAKLRLHSEKVLDRIAGPEDAGIFKAAVLGSKGDLDTQIRDLYQKSGIAHLLAISGLHLSLVGLGAYRILRKSGLGYGGAGFAGAVLVAGYGILTGGSPSVKRAVIMLCISFLAGFLGRTYDLLSAVSLALLLLSWDSPMLITQGGFQLSFGAVLGLGAAAPCLNWFLQPERVWQKALVGGISVQLFTVPVILFHFYQYPPYSLLLNLAVVPLMGVVVCSGIAGILLGSFSTVAGTAALWAGRAILKLYYALCLAFGLLPANELTAGRPSWGRIFLYYGFLCAFLLWCRKNVGTEKGLKRLCAVAAASRWGIFAGASMIMALLFYPPPVRGLEVTFLDVGQGDGIVLRSGRRTVLVDGGSSSEKELGKYCLEPFLKSRGSEIVDFAIISHGDKDHYSGLKELMESGQIQVRVLILPALGAGDEVDMELKDLVRRQGGQAVEMRAGDRLAAGAVTLTCLYPDIGDSAPDRNDQSLVMEAVCGDFHLLLTGDMSSMGEAEMLRRPEIVKELGKIQALKVGHHGSDTSTGPDFLRPQPLRWAVISYGKGNSYGHPAPDVVRRLEENGVSVWETAKCGAITLHTDGETVSWQTKLTQAGEERP